jgi:aryl-alcohol dehydrogenase-like predicted oxidoreductase
LPALYHARRCLDQCLANGIRDFDLAYAYEGMARAHAYAGQAAEARRFHQLAEQTGRLIAEEEDRQLFHNDLAAGPWFE